MSEQPPFRDRPDLPELLQSERERPEPPREAKLRVLEAMRRSIADAEGEDRSQSLRLVPKAAGSLMGWLFGSSIALYRKIHWQHHRALGTTMDSENSYFDALGIGYLVQGLTGFKALRTLRQYRRTESAAPGTGSGDRARRFA